MFEAPRLNPGPAALLTRAARNWFELTSGHVHVWVVWTVAPPPVSARLKDFLAPEQTDRIARFRFEWLRNRHVVVQSAQRLLLSRYLGIAPAEVAFEYGKRGKPSVASSRPVRFNTSHSGELSLFAFTPDCDLGIDIEQIRQLSGTEDIARAFFCKEEAGELTALTGADHARGFFRCWTRKEAYVKAVGEGLSAALNSFRVTLQPGEPARMLWVDNDDADAWTIHNLDPWPGYVGALAYRSAEHCVEMRPILQPSDLLRLA